jgi:hypothetical protein
MQITDQLSFWGNALALVALTLKTIYDLLINPRQFNSQSNGGNEVAAAKAKRKRADLTTALTFLFLAIASGLMMLALIKR